MRHFTIIVIICISTVSYSQNFDNTIASSVVDTMNYQRLVFVTFDSTYNCIKFIGPTGDFNIELGIEDSSFEKHRMFIFNRGAATARMVCYKYFQKTDTIINYFPNTGKCYYRDSTYYENQIMGSSKNASIFHIYNHINTDIENSYILKQLGEPLIFNSKYEIFRVLEPVVNFPFTNKYRMFKVLFYEDSAKLYLTLGHSIDYKGMKIVMKDSCILKKKDITCLKKLLNNIKIISDSCECAEGTPSIYEFKFNSEYKRFIVSFDCLQKYRPKNKSLYPIEFELNELLYSFSRKYFKSGYNLLKNK